MKSGVRCFSSSRQAFFNGAPLVCQYIHPRQRKQKCVLVAEEEEEKKEHEFQLFLFD